MTAPRAVIPAPSDNAHDCGLVLVYSRRVHRCLHLADEERGRITRLPYSMTAELCCVCVEEWQTRLNQLPDSRAAEIERQGKDISRAFEQHQRQRAGCWE